MRWPLLKLSKCGCEQHPYACEAAVMTAQCDLEGMVGHGRTQLRLLEIRDLCLVLP